MTAMIEEEDISHLNLENSLYVLENLNNYIHYLEQKEPPSYEKEDHYYWSMEFDDALYEKRLIIQRATFLLDKQLDDYFSEEFVWFWSKEAACKILREAVA